MEYPPPALIAVTHTVVYVENLHDIGLNLHPRRSYHVEPSHRNVARSLTLPEGVRINVDFLEDLHPIAGSKTKSRESMTICTQSYTCWRERTWNGWISGPLGNSAKRRDKISRSVSPNNSENAVI